MALLARAPPILSTIFSTTLTTNGGAFGSGVVSLRGEAIITANIQLGAQLRVTLGSGSGGMNFSGVAIGKKAAAGNAWDTTLTPVPLLFSGSASGSVSASSSLVSDYGVANFSALSGEKLQVIIDLTNATALAYLRNTVLGQTYQVTGSTTYNQATPVGLSSNGAETQGFSKIEMLV